MIIGEAREKPLFLFDEVGEVRNLALGLERRQGHLGRGHAPMRQSLRSSFD
jgi:hypothetical protein